MIDRARLHAIVREAGAIAMASWPGDSASAALKVWDKSPNNPVSAADLAVDDFLRVELGKPLVERLLVIRKGLHAVGKRTLRRLLDRGNLVGELVARGVELLEAAGDTVLGSQIRGEPRLQLCVILLQASERF